MKLVRKDNHAIEVEATYECVYAKAWCTPTGRNAAGEILIDYDGGSEVFWDTQETVKAPSGARQFVDANGAILDECDVELIEEDAK